MNWLLASLLFVHVMSGALALISFWVPLLVPKGKRTHRVVGRFFAINMLLSGVSAMVLAGLRLTSPTIFPASASSELEAHLFLGWMMLYLGLLAVVLVLFGLKTVRNKGRHELYRTPWLLGLHSALALLAVWIFYLGWTERQVLLIGVAFIAFLVVPGNFRFILKKPVAAPGKLRREWLYQHFTAMVGAGIAGYTAFLSFGAARFMPTQTFNPYLWTIPTIVGVTFLLWLAKRQPRYD